MYSFSMISSDVLLSVDSTQMVLKADKFKLDKETNIHTALNNKFKHCNILAYQARFQETAGTDRMSTASYSSTHFSLS